MNDSVFWSVYYFFSRAAEMIPSHMVRLNDPKGLFQAIWFYNSMNLADFRVYHFEVSESTVYLYYRWKTSVFLHLKKLNEGLIKNCLNFICISEEREVSLEKKLGSTKKITIQQLL